MAEAGIAKLFQNGRSQAVRLPREFRFEGSQVRVRRLADGVLLEPMIGDTAEWFAELDRVREGQLFGKGNHRAQSIAPRRRIFE